MFLMQQILQCMTFISIVYFHTYNGAHVFFQISTHAVVTQCVKTGTECACAGRWTNHVLQDEIPANQKRHEFTHCDVTVHVGGTGSLGHAHAEFLHNTHLGKRKRGWWCNDMACAMTSGHFRITGPMFRSKVDSPPTGRRWCVILMFSLLFAWPSYQTNSRVVGDLRRLCN